MLPTIARADTITFAADQTIVSVGDPVTVRLVWTVSPLPRLASSYTYKIPGGSQYAANSIVLNGTALADTDPRVTVATDSVRVTLGAVAVGTTTVTLRVRATGTIGTGLPHFGALITGASVQDLRGFATRIVDENATVLLPALQQDTHISESQSNYNYGGATQVELRTGTEQRAILKLNMASVTLPGTHEVAAAYIEVFPAGSGISGLTVNAFRLKRTWTEGTQTGAPCIAGASWTRRDCINSWTSGGDYDTNLVGSGYADPSTRFLSIDIKSLAADWLAGQELDQGVILIASGASNKTLSFPSKEGASVAARPARLVIVIAPKTTYTTKAVKDAKAEIVPNVVITKVPNQRFVYTVKPSFDSGDTGMNRVTITIPSPFTLVSVDTVKAAGSVLNRNNDEALVAGEFEIFGFGSTLDVRFAPPVIATTPDKHIDIILRAGTPNSADLTGKNFSSIVDHDRRGYAAQSAVKGNANDRAGDGDTWLVRTNSASIVSVTVTPADTTVNAGYSVPYRARAKYSDGSSADVTDFAIWSVLPEIGTWETPGLLRTTTQGDAAVSASFGSIWSAPVALHVAPPALLQLWITPSSASMVAGLTRQYEAYGRYSTQDTLLVTSSAAWTLADTMIARLQSPGLVRGKKSGSTLLSASLESRTAPSATVSVTPAELVSIAIAPTDTSVALGYSKQLHAWGTYTDESRSNLRSVVTWQVNPSGVVDVDADGLATTLAVGTANITATLGAITSAGASFTVQPPVLVSIAVTPADTSVALGYGVQMRATGTYSNGTKANLSSSVSWQTTPAGVVNISSGGFATTIAQGTAGIRAALGTVTSPAANFTVTAAVLVSIGVAPVDTSVALGFTGRVRATGTYSNGSKSNLTSPAAWLATPSGLVTIDTSGTVTTLSVGTATLTATRSSVTSPPASFTVTPPVLVSIAVTPADTSVALGFAGRVRAYGTYSNGSTANLTSTAVWQANPAGLVGIDSGGNVTTLAAGTATVTARHSTITSPPASLTVTPPALVSIAVIPADTTIALGYNVQMTARGYYSNSSSQNITSLVTWQTAPAGIISINSTGLASSISSGSTSITAKSGSVTSPAASFNVTPAVLLSLNGSPDMATVPVGNTQAYVSTGTYSNATTSNLTNSVTWQSLDPGVADFISPGNVQGTSQGLARLVHRLGSVVGDTLQLRVTIASLDSIRVSPNPVDLPPGIESNFTATAHFSDGSSLDVTAQSAWSSDDTTVVSVEANGLATTRAEGLAGIVAQTLNIPSGPCNVTVTTAALDSFYVVPADTTLSLGSDLAYRARGSLGAMTYDFTDASSWSTTDSLLASASASGLVSTHATGNLQVRARFGTRVATPGDLRIDSPSVTSLQVLPADTTVALGRAAQMRAIATYSDGSTTSVTGAVAWQTSPSGIASVSASGVVTTLSAGNTNITASLSAVTSAAATLTVSPPVLVTLDGAPDTGSVPAGMSHAVTSTGTYSDGGTADKTAVVIWTSLDPAVASFESQGVVRAHAAGSARLLHSLGSVQGDTLHLTVRIPRLDSLRVDPCPVQLPPGARRQLAAWGRYDNGSLADLTSHVAWSTGDSAVASVDSIGRLTTIRNGSTFVRATQGAVSSVACSVLVDAAALTSLSITPADTTVRLGDSVVYRAWGRVGPDIYDLTAAVAWTSADTLVAAIAAGGVASTRATGSTAIGATLESVAALAANLRVDPPSVVAIEILPATSSVRLGGTKAMTARARLSNNVLVDVTSVATWSSSAPSIVYMSNTGVGTGIALGTASIIATYATVASAAAALTVLPAVEVEAIATGTRSVVPGAADQLLLTLRLSNRYIDARRLTALEVQSSGPLSSLRLRVDDGDGLFEPQIEPVLAAGAPSASQWTATNLNLDIPIAGSRTLFVSCDVSLDSAVQGDSVDLKVPNVGALFWEAATAITASGFPLDSDGKLRVVGFVLAQLDFNSVPDDGVTAGTANHLVLDVQLPDNGGRADTLEQLSVDQVGTARAVTEITRMRLLAGPSPWSQVADLIFTGGRRWSANGLALGVPAGGRPIRVVTDVALTAEPMRTIQAQLPVLGAGFASARLGPADGAFLNPGTLTIESPHTLIVENSAVAPSGVVQRTARQLPVLGLRLTAYSAETDTLLRLDLVNTTTGAAGPAANPNGQIAAAALWLDTNADGVAGVMDVRLDTVTPAPGNVISFGASAALDLPLATATPATLLVTVDPDSTAVRDAELLSVALVDATGLDSARELSVQIQGSVVTLVPPIVDGQAASGYAVRPIENQILLVGSSEFLVLDFMAPANGVAADVLTGIRLENSGSATRTDIASIALRRDDGDGIFTAADSVVAMLAPTGQRTWENLALSFPLSPGVPSHFFVTVRTATTAQPGGSFHARVPLEGIRVASGNDGPNDVVLDGGGPLVMTAGNQVTWVAGIAGSHTVRPDARKQVVMILETLNGYSSTRHLSSLALTLRGTAAASEYDTWALYPDTNRNGRIDDAEIALGIASPSSGTVRFVGLQYAIQPLQQQRLLVAYTLALGNARDGSVVDVVILNAESFAYSQPGTGTLAQFEMDSLGEDTIDGHIVRQIVNHPVTSQTLGGSEAHVLALDLTLPSNGWAPDVLDVLEVQLSPEPDAAIFGDDITAVRLWREQDTNPVTARFDPSEDLLVRSLLPGESQLRFEALAAAIPVGGHRFYVTVDISPTIVDGRSIQLRVPINGVAMQSDNDGPLDEVLAGRAIHHLSASDLLAAASVRQLQISRGQILDLRVGVRNRGGTTLAGVVPLAVEWSPPLPVRLVSGPSPASLTLAPGESDTLAYEFTVDAVGETQCIITVGMPDSTVVGNPASSPRIMVQEPPSGLVLEPLSNLPTTVSRGQANLVPVIWNFMHPDSAALAAPISIRNVRLDVENATGGGQVASAVFSRLELRSGGQSYALVESVPDSSSIAMQLDPEFVLAPGEERDILLIGTIALAAPANSFRLRLVNAAGVGAVDANSGQPVAVTAPLPWASNLALIRTVASHVDVTFERTLPSAANRGQKGVPAGRIRFALPGSAGESEARITQLALAIRDLGGQAVDPRSFIDRLEVRSGAATLLSTTQLDTVAGRLLLPLTIQKSIASGAPESLDLSLDLRDDALTGPFAHWVPDAAALEVQDAISGAVLVIRTTSPDSLPFDFGSFVAQSPASDVALAATARTPAATVPGALRFPVAGLHFTHNVAPGSADVFLRTITFRTLDAAGSSLEPRDLLQGARLLLGSSVLVSVDAPSAGGSGVRFDLAPPLRMAPGAALDLSLEADLSPSLSEPWIRFDFESTAFDVQDANDPARPLFVTGTIPFATPLVQIVQPTTAVSFGVAVDPPANAPRGALAFPLLALAVAHPGSVAQAPLEVSTLTILVRDAAGNGLPANAVAGAARLRSGSSIFEATMVADSMRFTLNGLAPLDGGTRLDLGLEFDVLAAPAVSDLRLAVNAGGLAATSAGRPLMIQVAEGATLPYLSPAIHLTAANLQESLSNYPNPFVAGRESTRFTFYLPEPAVVSAEIYALDGARVVRLLNASQLAAGLHDDLEWNGRNGAGQLVRNGTYLLRLHVSGAQGGKLLRKLAVKR